VTLTLGGDGITNTAPTGINLSWGAPIILNASQTWWANPGLSATLTTTATISGPGSSALTIAGGGAFVFQAANTYNGSTTVTTAGTSLTVSSLQAGTGAIAINDGTTLAVNVSGNGQLSPSSFSLGSSAGPTTNTFTGLNSTTLAPVTTGVLTVKGLVTINVSASTLAVGIYPLISYTSHGGTGGFALGTLPAGVTANISTNGNAIALNVTAVTPLVWTGRVNGNWDTTTTNWTFLGSPAAYQDGEPVQFDDTSSVTNVTIMAAAVSPSSVTVNNNSKYFTFLNGGGTIGGGASLTKTGTNTLNLSTAISSSGPITISSGTLVLNAGNYTLPKNVNVVCNGTLDLNNTVEQFAGFGGNGLVFAEDFGLLYVGVGTATFTFSGIISDTAGHNTGITFEKGGQGVVTLTGLNTYTGPTQVQKATLSLGDGTTAGNIANSAVINLNGAGAGVQSTLLINYPVGSSNGYAGQITGQGFLVKSGGGTYSLSGGNSFGQGGSSTTINGGILQVDGSLAAGNPVFVQSGGTLAGTGTIGEVTTVSAGGTVSPGDANGALGGLTLGSDLNLNAGAAVLLVLNKTNSPATNDTLVVSGNLNVTNGILTITNSGPSLVAGDSFSLLSQPASGFTTVTLPTLAPGLVWANNIGVNGSIQVLVAPPNFQRGAVTVLADGNVSLAATGSLGSTYILWASTNLAAQPVASTWTLLTNGTVTASPFAIRDLSATNYPRRFYQFSTP